jgi:BirA family biotin operon repressor/biotin-[acetyl-CoA-carboxylase] ligase
LNFTTIRFDSLPSTNDEAARQAKLGAAQGVCIVAREQTMGRGRRANRRWHSPADAGLYFSVILHPKISAKDWGLISLTAAIAAQAAISESCGLQTDIKWANDILSNNKKLCGILAETVEVPGGNGVVLGIGINLKKEAIAPDLIEIATAVEIEIGSVPNANSVLEALTQNLQKYYEILHQTNGNQQIIETWTTRSSYAVGKLVRVVLENESLTGITCGLGVDGALRVQIESNLIKTIYAGDVIALRTQNNPEKYGNR